MMKLHVNGDAIYKKIKGKDSSESFNLANHSKSAVQSREKYLVGVFDGDYIEETKDLKLKNSKFIKKCDKKNKCEQQCNIF